MTYYNNVQTNVCQWRNSIFYFNYTFEEQIPYKQKKHQLLSEIDIFYIKAKTIKAWTDFPMVPIARIELAADPYQGPVLPLYYIGLPK